MSAKRGSVARVYDRVAPLYDWYEAPMDAMGGRARRRRVSEGARGEVLEVGVGTGRSSGMRVRRPATAIQAGEPELR